MVCVVCEVEMQASRRRARIRGPIDAAAMIRVAQVLACVRPGIASRDIQPIADAN